MVNVEIGLLCLKNKMTGEKLVVGAFGTKQQSPEHHSQGK